MVHLFHADHVQVIQSLLLYVYVCGSGDAQAVYEVQLDLHRDPRP